MKYGSPTAINSVATGVVKYLLDLSELAIHENLALASSAYGSIPNAAATVVDQMAAQFRNRGIAPVPIKFHRHGGFAMSNYGCLNPGERQLAMSRRTVTLNTDCAAKLAGKTLVVFDDLRCTGAHEDVLVKLLNLSEQKPSRVLFVYWIRFSDTLNQSNPQFEDLLNHAKIETLEDLMQCFSESKSESGRALTINARLVKFILKGGSGNRHFLLPEFFHAAGRDFCQQLFSASQSTDGYCRHRDLSKGFQILLRHIEMESQPKRDHDH